MSNSAQQLPSCGDLVGLLAEPARRSAFAALVLGAGTAAAVAQRTGLTPKESVQALRKLVDGRVATEDDGSYVLQEDTFREAIRTEARLTGGSGGGAAQGRISGVAGLPLSPVTLRSAPGCWPSSPIPSPRRGIHRGAH